MKNYLLAAGIPKHQVRIRAGNYKIATLANAFDWLHNLYLLEYNDYFKIRKLLPEEVWNRYALFGYEGLREQELLEKVRLRLLRAWKKKRPQIFNKDKIKKRD